PAMGRAACEAATDGPVAQGSIGAGTGARLGTLYGPLSWMKGGIGTASTRLSGGLVVGALVVVNCYGDVVDPDTGEILAGARKPTDRNAFADSLQALGSRAGQVVNRFAMRNTVIGVVATNARLTKEEANK